MVVSPTAVLSWMMDYDLCNGEYLRGSHRVQSGSRKTYIGGVEIRPGAAYMKLLHEVADGEELGRTVESDVGPTGHLSIQ